MLATALGPAARAELLTSSGRIGGPIDPPASVVEGAIESDTHALLFREQQNLLLAAAVDVDVTQPGLLGLASLTPGSIAAGTRVDSWLVHVDPVGTSSDRHAFAFTLHFDRDVLGVMVDRHTKLDADPVLAAPGTSYSPGGLEVGTDLLDLSDDRRTLSLAWLGSNGLDQIRVVTEGTPEPIHLANFRKDSGAWNEGEDGFMRIGSPFTTGDPSTLVFLTNLGGRPPPISTWYDDVAGKRALRAPTHHGHGGNLLLVEPGPDAFVHTTSAANTTANVSYIDHPRANGDPDARLLVMHDAGIGAAVVEHRHHVGVFYNAFLRQWAIFNEDRASMETGLSFNVLVLPDDGTSFVHTIDASNHSPTYGFTWIEHPLLDGKPGAAPLITHNWSVGGGHYHDGYATLAYGFQNDGWGIEYSHHEFPDPVGHSFNVYVPPASSFSVQHRADASNTLSNFTRVDDPATNQTPVPVLLETPTLAPVGAAGTPNPGATGLWYTGTQWSTFNQNTAVAYPHGAASNLFQPGGPASRVVHVADASNIEDYWTRLGGLRAWHESLVFVTPNWNASGEAPGVYNDHNIGVRHSGGWAIFNQDQAPMPPGAAFNVYITDRSDYDVAFLSFATAANTSGSAMVLDHPTLNGSPGARVLVTQSWNPNGGTSGVYNDHPIATDYDTEARRWQIVNQDGAALPLGAAFNVMALPEPATTSMLAAGVALLGVLARRRGGRAACRPSSSTARRISPLA